MSTRPIAPQYPLVSWIGGRSPRQRRLAAVLLAIATAAVLARFFAGLALDSWWFGSLGASEVWTTKIGAQLLLAVISGTISGVVLIGSAVVALSGQPAPDNSPNRLV